MAIQKITGEDKQHAQLLQVLNKMQGIRSLEVNGAGSPQERNEYLCLSQEQGELLITNPGIHLQIDGLLAMAEKGEGVRYDPYFLPAWEKVLPGLATDLENLTILLMGDDFSGFEDTHHLWNAVRYLTSIGKPKPEVLKIFDSIIPVWPSRSLRDFSVTGQDPGPNTLHIGRETEDLEGFLKRAGEIGFERVVAEIDLNHNSYGERMALREFRATNLTEKKPEPEPAKVKKKFSFFDVLAKIYNPYSLLHSAPIDFILGGLPARLQNYIEQKLRERGVSANSDQFTVINCFGETAISAGAAIACGLVLGPLAWFPAAAYFAYSGVRTLSAFNGNNSVKGNLLWKLPLLPFESRIGKKKPEPKPKDLPENWAQIEFITPNPRELNRPRKHNQKYTGILDSLLVTEPAPEAQTHHNLHPSVEKLGAVQLADEVEENLKHSQKNHNTQGVHYKHTLMKKEKQLDGCELDRNLDAITGYNILSVDAHQKVSALVCFKGQRYAITMVTQGPFKPQELPKLLADSAKPIAERLEGIAKYSGALYAHITQFTSCQKVADLVWRKD